MLRLYSFQISEKCKNIFTGKIQFLHFVDRVNDEEPEVVAQLDQLGVKDCLVLQAVVTTCFWLENATY
jgi:hypothetical protein